MIRSHSVLKKIKDSNRPKPARSALYHYSQANRADAKANNPDATFGDLARILHIQYKALSDNDRAKWEEKAEKDKLRYAEEMKHYVPPDQSCGSATDELAYGSDSGGRKKKARRDTNMPETNTSAFYLYTIAVCPDVKQNNPVASLGDIARIISRQFAALSDEEREKWDAKAEQELRSQQEGQVARETKMSAEEMKHHVLPDDLDCGDDGGRKKARREPKLPKRNMSAYFLYFTAVRPDIREKNPGAAFCDIARVISQQFKALSEEERAKWDVKAEKDKLRYEQEMEVYRETH